MFTLAVDIKLRQDAAILFCENLATSSLTFKQTRTELAAFASWFSAKTRGCPHIWTPYSDREEEGKITSSDQIQKNLLWSWCTAKGVWKSLQNGSTPPLLDPSLMAPGQPNGGHSENGLTIRWEVDWCTCCTWCLNHFCWFSPNPNLSAPGRWWFIKKTRLLHISPFLLLYKSKEGVRLKPKIWGGGEPLA